MGGDHPQRPSSDLPIENLQCVTFPRTFLEIFEVEWSGRTVVQALVDLSLQLRNQPLPSPIPPYQATEVVAGIGLGAVRSLRFHQVFHLFGAGGVYCNFGVRAGVMAQFDNYGLGNFRGTSPTNKRKYGFLVRPSPQSIATQTILQIETHKSHSLEHKSLPRLT